MDPWHLGGHIMDDNEKIPHAPSRFNSISQVDVPKGRDGKHKKIITLLLEDIAQLKPGSALKIPLAELPDSKENIRAALSRAAALKKLAIATSSNSDFLYVWKTGEGN
jgi:TusA-related sulfurtransferase